MDALYDKHFTCPVCKNHFASKQVKKKYIKVIERDTDLMVRYDGENPMIYSVVVCSKCGYSNLSSKFEELSFKKKQIYEEDLRRIWKEKNYSDERTLKEGIETFKMLLFCEDLIQSKLYEKAGTLLKISWLYRMLNNEKEERKYQMIAIEFYKESYQSEDLSRGAVNDVTVNYLIAELSYRLNDLQTAIKWMSSLITNPSLKNHPQIDKLARARWLEIKAEKDKLTRKG